MITYSVIQKSQLEGAHRLDAEYYQPIFLQLEDNLKTIESRRLIEIANVTGGKRLPVGEIFSEKGIPYARVVDIYNTFIEFDNVKYISEKLYKLLRFYQIKNEDILVTIVGNTVGMIGYNQYDLDKFNFTENCARVRAKNILPEFILAVLLSKIGQLQVGRERVGTAQPKLSLDRLRNFLIPIVSETKQLIMKELIAKSLEFYNSSKSFYSQAGNLLSEELGLRDFKPEDDLSFIVNFSDVKSVNRMDAEYFQPKYEKLISKIKEQNSKPLFSILENVQAKFNPLTKPEMTFHYVELANINSSIGLIDGYNEVLGKEAPSRAKRILKTGDVIVSSVEGSLEKVALVSDEYNDSLASTGFFQFRSSELLPEVLLILAKSIVLKMQLEKQCAGTILTAVPKEALRNIILPILPKTIQQKVAVLVKKSHEARKKSKELLEEAKRKVEEMIEKTNRP